MADGFSDASYAKIVHDFKIESWTWYGVSVFVALTRFGARTHQVGLKKLGPEDYIMFVVCITLAITIILLNLGYEYGNNLLPANTDLNNSTPEMIAQLVRGSEITFVMEHFNIATQWGIKACLLILYHRMSAGYELQNKVVSILAVYCVLAVIVLEALYLGYWCRPVQQYWAVPVQNEQCATYHNHLILSAVFAISVDVCMFCIPLPMLLRTSFPKKQKIFLCILFGIGVFEIAAAFVSRLHPILNPFEVDWGFWLVRESGTAVIIANLPYLSGMILRIFRWHHDRTIMAVAKGSYTRRMPRTTKSYSGDSGESQKPAVIQRNSNFV